MKLQLVTLDGVKFDQDVYEVIAPTATGHIAVFDNHEPLVNVAVAGVLTVVHEAGDPEEKRDHFAIEGGIIEINQHSVRILVDDAAHSSEIIEGEAREALERAYTFRDQSKDKLSLEHAQVLIDRESTRLKVAELRRHRHRQK
ncbi:MAG TPA: ATP synthase F1 subunit epsilon [Candidatus Saccharimonadales bacterium]|nr:ATP synthase F1 subunit epsilon [Candidatus Saccharimonadales bacterium]